MSKIDEGGQVYPQLITTIHADKAYVNSEAGITRRDWLAGLAMQTLLKESHARNGDVEWQVKVAWKAYSIADVVIAEGKKGE